MNITPGQLYLCIDPAAPMFQGRVEVTRIKPNEIPILPERVFFICENTPALAGWVFSQARDDFERNFTEYPAPPIADKHSAYIVESRPCYIVESRP